MPRVCVSMSVYKGNDWLKNVSIPCLLKQSLVDWALVAVGDGPQEGTAELLRGFGDGRIHYSEIERQAPPPEATMEMGCPWWNVVGARAMNASLDIIKRFRDCEVIAHLDQDDAWSPDHLKVLVGLLSGNKWADLAYSTMGWWRNDKKLGFFDIPFSSDRLLLANYIGHSSLAYRKDAPQDYHYPVEPTSEGPGDWIRLKSFLRHSPHKPFLFWPYQTSYYFHRCSLGFAVDVLKSDGVL